MIPRSNISFRELALSEGNHAHEYNEGFTSNSASLYFALTFENTT